MGLLDFCDFSLSDGVCANPLTIHREKRTFGMFFVWIMALSSFMYTPIAFYFAVSGNPNWEVQKDLLPVALVTWALWATTIFFDVCVVNSDAARANLRSAYANGFSTTLIVGTLSYNFMTSPVLGMVFLVGHDSAELVAHWDFTALWHLVAAVVICEVFFNIAHGWLHHTEPWIHKFHHCMFIPTFISGLCLEPTDVLVEFGLVIITGYVALRTDLLGMNDPFAFFLLICAIQLVVAAGHDRFVKNHHYGHHTHISSARGFFVRTGGWSRDEKERQRAAIKHPSLVEQAAAAPDANKEK